MEIFEVIIEIFAASERPGCLILAIVIVLGAVIVLCSI
jgi:hypothetical protein